MRRNALAGINTSALAEKLDRAMWEAITGPAMNILFERPPLFDEIDAKFHVAGQKVIFAWGDTIFNPERVEVTPELMAHETEHGKRQRSAPQATIEASVRDWWRRYLEDPAFRLAEEIPAHQAEYQAYCKTHRDRNARARYLFSAARRLASPLYGGLISASDAARVIGR